MRRLKQIALFVAFGASRAGAAEAASAFESKDGEPNISAWLHEAPDASGEFPRNVAFVTALPEKNDGIPQFMKLDDAAFNAATFLKTASMSTVAWDFKLNSN